MAHWARWHTPPRGHVTALLTPAACEQAGRVTERERASERGSEGGKEGEKEAEVEKRRESEKKGTQGEKTNHEPCRARCPILTKLYTNKNS